MKDQTKAAKRNAKKAQQTAASKKTISRIPAKTRTALGEQGAAVAQRRQHAQDPDGALRDCQAPRPAGPVEDGP